MWPGPRVPLEPSHAGRGAGTAARRLLGGGRGGPVHLIAVLVVDDYATFRQAARVALEVEGGFDVVGAAEDGATAIELARACQPDLVLLDLVMPGMGGLEALPYILEVAPAAKVAFLTTLDSRGAWPSPKLPAASKKRA